MPQIIRRAATVAMTAVAVLLSACTALRGERRLDPPAAEDGVAFQGLLAPPQSDAAAPRRYIFAIHGIGDTQDTYNRDTGRWLAKAGFRSVGPPGDWVRVHLRSRYAVNGEGLACRDGKLDDPCLFESFGRYQVETFARGAETVSVFTYFWQEDLWQVEGPYLAEDLKEPRAAINRYLKNEVVNKGLGDAAGYLGPLGELAREGVRGAVCAMMMTAAKQAVATQPVRLRPSQPGAAMTAGPAGSECLASLVNIELPAEAEFNFVSHSLGSRMLLDALAPYAAHRDLLQTPEDDFAKARLARKTRTLFMAANQVPLLGIGRVRVRELSDNRTGEQPCRTGSFLDFRCVPPGVGGELKSGAARPSYIQLDVVAFMDPDDLLGYQADSAMLGLGHSGDGESQDLANVRFTTVRHRNASQILGLLTPPGAAHDHEMQLKSAAELIFCGAATKAGKLKPIDVCLR